MKFITLLFCLTLLSSPAHAWRESHGGDSIVADFIGRTNDIIKTKASIQDKEIKTNLENMANLRNSILVVTMDRVYDEHGKEVPALSTCYWQEHDGRMVCNIAINRYNYLSLEKDSAQINIWNKEEVIVDEFSKILNISDNSKRKLLKELKKFNRDEEKTISKETFEDSIQEETVKDFIKTTHTLLEDLKTIENPLIKKIYNKILPAVSKTEYMAHKSVHLNGIEKDAVNTCLAVDKTEFACTIIINTLRWAQYNVSLTNQAERKKEQLVLHEFLAVIQENDRDYSLSEKIMKMLEKIRAKR
ncbi:hypothetical protein DOM21_12820 [Bacteriovorax stolpii]|uniref:Uncharacterized protein n=1 Tax=Bacteriovorax stolpii TaxID=960 RepID=A0A2K9NQC0_BACTC|nr:hypothetical protein [Bacteriovorax stolpii]AUN97708.1 hypothetical protein C0V70_06200 [Bacteriovorax stolpii]QDK42309.1 hypothetical protein DOM21_12820 [Bacteriovorax stolpii]TDP51527.1 hypothetical protein C8D79_2971 [Bacteriovorax stolpii]